MTLGFVGLGRMGSRMVIKLVKEGHEVVVWNRTTEKISNLQFQISNPKFRENLIVADSVKDLITKLSKPRVIWSMLPAHSGLRPSGSKTGNPTQEILDRVENDIGVGDIVIDGGNAHYTDTQKRYDHFKSKNIRFLGIGVSGGIIA